MRTYAPYSSSTPRAERQCTRRPSFHRPYLCVCELDEYRTQRIERKNTVQRDSALGERITGGLVLKAIYLCDIRSQYTSNSKHTQHIFTYRQLLAEPAPVAHGVRGEEGLADVDALVSHHGGEERHHCILDVLRGQNTC